MHFKNLIYFCASKDTFKKVKRQPSEWERIFVNYIVDAGLVSRIYEELLQCNNEKINKLVKKKKKEKGKALEWTFSKEDKQMVGNCMKR